MGSPLCTIDASSASDAIQVPNGTTGERPSGLTAAQQYGMMRYNESLGLVEKYDTNGWGVIDNPPVISGFSGIINENNSTTITVSGSNFQSGAVVSIGGAATSNSNRNLTTSYSNSSTLTANTNASSVNYVDNASFNITVTNPSGLANTLAAAGTIDSTLTWSTSAGSLGTWNDGSNSNSVTVSASDPDGTSVTYALTSGSLPPSTSLNTSTGAISTSGTGNLSSNTTYSFTITATSNSISVARAFSITVNQTKDGASAARATSPDYLRNTLSITTDGYYWVKVSPMSSARQMYINFGMRDSKDWCLMAHWNQSSSNSGSLQNINQQSQTDHKGYDIPWKGFLFDDDGTHYYSYFSSYQAYNNRGYGNGTTSGGNKSGYQVFIGGSGQMGFYNTGQSPCNWSSDNGMVGSGYDGTCGTYPTSLRFGFGYDSDPFIDAYITGQVKMWIWMDNKQPS